MLLAEESRVQQSRQIGLILESLEEHGCLTLLHAILGMESERLYVVIDILMGDENDNLRREVEKPYEELAILKVDFRWLTGMGN